MRDLQTELHREGWEVTNSDELFSIENEVVRWTLENKDKRLSIQAEFHAFGDLGARSDDLNDVLPRSRLRTQAPF
jgi:hypothetical protein